jgi:hypothetical protein
MKKSMITALLAGQILSMAQPAAAAELNDNRTQQMGMFGGVRVRMPLDGNTQQQRVRAGFAVAPTMQSRAPNGETRTRIGEGLELGLTQRDRPQLSIAGTPVSQLVQGPRAPDGRRLGTSTLGGVAIAVGATVVVLGVGWLLFSEWIDCDADEECS